MTEVLLKPSIAAFTVPSNPTSSIVARAFRRFLPWLCCAVAIQMVLVGRISEDFGFASPFGRASGTLDYAAERYTALHIAAVTVSSFTLASMVSLSLRRPRRLLVAGSIEGILLGLAFALTAIRVGVSGITPGQSLMLISDPLDRILVEFNLWFSERLGIMTDAQPLSMGMLIAPTVVVGVSLASWLWVRLITEMRLRRYPYTATDSPPAEGASA